MAKTFIEQILDKMPDTYTGFSVDTSALEDLLEAQLEAMTKPVLRTVVATPSDTTTYSAVDNVGVMVFTAGNLIIEDGYGNTTPVFAVTAGQVVNIPVYKIKAATTAVVGILYTTSAGT